LNSKNYRKRAPNYQLMGFDSMHTVLKQDCNLLLTDNFVPLHYEITQVLHLEMDCATKREREKIKKFQVFYLTDALTVKQMMLDSPIFPDIGRVALEKEYKAYRSHLAVILDKAKDNRELLQIYQSLTNNMMKYKRICVPEMIKIKIFF